MCVYTCIQKPPNYSFLSKTLLACLKVLRVEGLDSRVGAYLHHFDRVHIVGYQTSLLVLVVRVREQSCSIWVFTLAGDRPGSCCCSRSSSGLFFAPLIAESAVGCWFFNV